MQSAENGGNTAKRENKGCFCDFLVGAYMPAQVVEGQAEQDADPTVNIGPVIETAFGGHVHQMACQHFQNGKIGIPVAGEIDITGSRKSQCPDFRQQDNGRQCTGCE